MKKRTVTFEVEPVVLFEALKVMRNNTESLGQRLVTALLSETSLRDDLGLVYYGVSIVSPSQLHQEYSERFGDCG